MTRHPSRIFLLDLAVALIALLVLERAIARGLRPLEEMNTAFNAQPEQGAGDLARFHPLGLREPLAFLAGVRARLRPPLLVFAGDSQGIVVRSGAGGPYPQLVAQALARGAGGSVLDLQLAGADEAEQGFLLLAMLELGIRPQAVIRFHSLYALRRNFVRSELLPLYRWLPAADRAVTVTLPEEGPARAAGTVPVARYALPGEAAVGRWLRRSASARFSRLTATEKLTVLSVGPLGRLLPPSLRPRSLTHYDPPLGVMADGVRYAGEVTRVLRARGIRVLDVLAPIDRAAAPALFGARAEAFAYPRLERAVRDAGGEYADWIDLLPDSCYGDYANGERDPYHFTAAGHRELARRLLAALGRAGEPS